MSQFYDEFANDAEREQKQCVYQYWKEFETGKPLSYRERKKEEYELSQGRLITVAYKGVMMHIDFETDLEKEYQSIINKQNKMKTSKIKSIQNDGTWKDLFKFEVQMENGDVGGAFAKTQIPSWKVGDEKSYEYEQKGKFWNIKFLADAKPAWNGGSSAPKSYGKSPEDKADIARAVALKAAVDLHKGEGEPMEKQIGIICATAQAFEIYLTTGDNPYKDAIMDGKMSNADDLPF
jgi:hypothetical protein